MPGRHEAPKNTDPVIGLVVLALLVLLAVVITLAILLIRHRHRLGSDQSAGRPDVGVRRVVKTARSGAGRWMNGGS